jgi:hypothetical protein
MLLTESVDSDVILSPSDRNLPDAHALISVHLRQVGTSRAPWKGGALRRDDRAAAAAAGALYTLRKGKFIAAAVAAPSRV